MTDSSTTKAPVSNGETTPAKSGHGYGARAGEVITGNLSRGGDGKFTSAGNASTPKPSSTSGRRAVDLQRSSQKPKKPKKLHKPKVAHAVKPKKGPRHPDPAKAAARAQRRTDAAAKRAAREQAHLDRAVQAEMKRRESLAKREQAAADKAKRAAARQARRTAAELKRNLRAQQPAKGGGGKGSAAKKPTSKPDKPDKTAEAAKNRATVGHVLGVNTNALAALADGTPPAAGDVAALSTAGLISTQRDGTYATTASGRAVLSAAERGDTRQARAMLARGQEVQGSRAQRTAEQAKRREERQAKKPPHRTKSLVVFKDVTGHPRWVAVSSTAFQDRDGEIVSLKALTDDVARSDLTNEYGPLRWWHVPGLDIGDCDYRAMHGRSLIESGTFRDERYVALVKSQDQISLGFLHPDSEPDKQRVFNTINTFERSLIPYPQGRASNLFTQITIKESDMDENKRAALAERVGPDLLARLLDGIEQTEKAADQQRVAHKASRVAVWNEALGAWQEIAVKAAPDPAMAASDTPEDPMMEDPADEDLEPGAYFSPEELQEIISALAPAVASAVIDQLAPMLNMEAKMGKFTDELKGLVVPQMAQKDAALAEHAALVAKLKEQQSAIDTRLQELEGEQPAARGFRASQSAATVVDPSSTLKDQQPQGDPNFLQFFGVGQ